MHRKTIRTAAIVLASLHLFNSFILLLNPQDPNILAPSYQSTSCQNHRGKCTTPAFDFKTTRHLKEPAKTANLDQYSMSDSILRPNHARTHQICVIVRTHRDQAKTLPITLLSLTQQSYRGTDVALSLFLVNTDSESYLESEFMHVAAADANTKAGHDVVTVLDATFHQTPPSKTAYGYDVTDRVLELLLEGRKNCTHFLFTNGDNFYLQTLVEWIKPSIEEGKQLIAWDFLSHHKRKYNVIKVQFIRQHVDLGSVLVDKRAVQMNRPHSKFLPHGSETKDLFARDFFFFREIFDHLNERNVSIIPQVLFAHQ